MQWFKSAMVASSTVFVAALTANGCSGPSGGGFDAGKDGKVTGTDGGKDTGTVKDSGTVDSGKDTGTVKDSGTVDSGNDTGTVKDSGNGQDGASSGCPVTDPACEVCDVTSFIPEAQGAPIGPNAGKCSPTDIQAFVDACLGTKSSPANCTAWQQAQSTGGNPDCLACTFTEDTAANWGVLHCSSIACSLNIPGCLDLALNQVAQENVTSTGSCGDLLNASYGCQDAACGTCATPDFSTCVNDALGAECKTYRDAFQNGTPCQVLNGDAAPAAVNACFPASVSGYTDAEYVNFANFFCGQ